MGEKKATPDRSTNRAAMGSALRKFIIGRANREEMGPNFHRLIIGHPTRTAFAVGRTIDSDYIILDDDNGIFQ